MGATQKGVSTLHVYHSGVQQTYNPAKKIPKRADTITSVKGNKIVRRFLPRVLIPDIIQFGRVSNVVTGYKPVGKITIVNVTREAIAPQSGLRRSTTRKAILYCIL